MDSVSSGPEQIAHAANEIGRSKLRRRVFEAIYFGKKPLKTVQDIADHTGLSRKQVLNEGRKLANSELVRQEKHNGDTAYRKIDFFHHNKARILRLAGDPHKLAVFPTKRSPAGGLALVRVPLDTARARTIQLTVDDLPQFARVRKVRGSANLSSSVSEKQFKSAVQAILGESGEFVDWGGEPNDLYTTRLIVDGRRRAAAFGFKGPGTQGRLTPRKMGKNGDQIQRLFEAHAEVFVVQYRDQISQSITDLMAQLALAKSVMNGGKRIWYGVIDGQDSARIHTAYRASFR